MTESGYKKIILTFHGDRSTVKTFVTRDDTWSPRYVNKHVIHSLVERNEYRGRYLRNVNSIEK